MLTFWPERVTQLRKIQKSLAPNAQCVSGNIPLKLMSLATFRSNSPKGLVAMSPLPWSQGFTVRHDTGTPPCLDSLYRSPLAHSPHTR
jgi:hypothetical protein